MCALALALASGGALMVTRPTATSQLIVGAVTSGAVSGTLAGSGTVAALGNQSVSFPASAGLAVGTTHVEITDGVSVGESVVVADASLPISTSEGTSMPGLQGLGSGGIPGGGMPPR